MCDFNMPPEVPSGGGGGGGIETCIENNLKDRTDSLTGSEHNYIHFFSRQAYISDEILIQLQVTLL